MSKKTCPQKQYLSVYHDGAVPSPWKEKMEAHLSICKECADTLASYRTASSLLNDLDFVKKDCADSNQLNDAKNRVFEKLQSANSHSLQNHSIYSASPAIRIRSGLLSRSIDVPLPFVAAAAAVLVLAISTLFVGKQNHSPLKTLENSVDALQMQPISYESDELHEYDTAKNINEVLNYLNKTNDSQDIVIIRLPEKNTFKKMGEPKLYNVADYKETGR